MTELQKLHLRWTTSEEETENTEWEEMCEESDETYDKYED